MKISQLIHLSLHFKPFSIETWSSIILQTHFKFETKRNINSNQNWNFRLSQLWLFSCCCCCCFSIYTNRISIYKHFRGQQRKLNSTRFKIIKSRALRWKRQRQHFKFLNSLFNIFPLHFSFVLYKNFYVSCRLLQLSYFT